MSHFETKSKVADTSRQCVLLCENCIFGVLTTRTMKLRPIVRKRIPVESGNIKSHKNWPDRPSLGEPDCPPN